MVLLGPHAFCEGLVDDDTVATGIQILLLEVPTLDDRNTESLEETGVTKFCPTWKLSSGRAGACPGRKTVVV
jgi:hypothetical protein